MVGPFGFPGLTVTENEVGVVLPSIEGVVRCVVDRNVIEGNTTPTLITGSGESFNISLDRELKSA